MHASSARNPVWLAAAALAIAAQVVAGGEPRRLILPEQRHLRVRDPEQFPRAPLPNVPAPATVSKPRPAEAVWNLTLDEAIGIALANSDVVRTLAGDFAVAAGPTIFDPAIANTAIDQNRARFDPTLNSTNTFSQLDQPAASIIGAGPPPSVAIGGAPREGFNSTTELSKTFISGGTASVGVAVNRGVTKAPDLALNPETATATELRLAQPLWQGAGARANLAPILVARIDTERSFFQLKDGVQETVRGVVEGYWSLLAAQTNAWARRQQWEQGREALARAEARQAAGLGEAGEVSQARVSAENFRATLIEADARVLQQEAALRNLLGLPPTDERRLIPSTPLSKLRLNTDWDSAVSLAEQYRPDLIELKLILEADQQQLLLARNNAQPRLDAVGLYRWNGLDGRTPDGGSLRSGGGQFDDWELGVNFSVPLGLRRERAQVRERELLIQRDQANLRQGLHAASHQLAVSYRNLAQFYEQYLAFGRVRQAAEINLERQLADFRAGRRTLYINVLLAISDWGNAVSSEVQALAQYNTELASLERQTGTILETHGVRFVEERYRSVGPLGHWCSDRCYPRAMRPGPNAPQAAVAPADAYQMPRLERLPPVEPIEPGKVEQ